MIKLAIVYVCINCDLALIEQEINNWKNGDIEWKMLND